MCADVIFCHTINLRRKRLPATSGVEKQGLREQKHLGQGHLDTDCLALEAHPAWPYHPVSSWQVARSLVGHLGGHISKDILCPYFHSWLELKMFLHRQLSV